MFPVAFETDDADVLAFNAPQGRAQLVPDFHALIDDFDETLLAARQQAALAAAGLPETRPERKWARNPQSQ
jgi:hypothetical protein